MDWQRLVQEAEAVIREEPRLIRLSRKGKAVFVGDTHGDLSASREVIDRYLRSANRVVFLGDYVDRGNQSEENLLFLLQQKTEHPKELFLLAGNHEGYPVKEFSPADFWESISIEKRRAYGRLFSLFPLVAASSNGILALHGGVPDLESIEAINEIRLGDAAWDRIVWGDFVEREGEELGDLGGRPRFGRTYFERMMKRYDKKVLIRSHQPCSPSFMFERRCITILTSFAYFPVRTVVIADLEKDVETGRDVTIQKV
jgi:hypothetical protein